MINRNRLRECISFLLIFSIMFTLVACSSTAPNPTLSDPNPQIMVENVETENIITENIIIETFLTEVIISERYLEETIIAEKRTSELLLMENTITEVMSCELIYVPQDNIDKFSVNGQAAQLFGDEVDISALLKKVAVGTGVIVTIVVLEKAGLSEPIACVVFSAADESLKSSGEDAVIGSLFGGLVGAANEIDESGRTAAVIGFATATVGLILSIISLVAEIPSGGSTTITATAGVKFVIAAVSLLAAMKETADAGRQAVKTFTSTDLTDIDWDNIDWQKVGVSSLEKTLENAADGYMCGAIIGAVHGGAEGYDSYQK